MHRAIPWSRLGPSHRILCLGIPRANVPSRFLSIPAGRGLFGLPLMVLAALVFVLNGCAAFHPVDGVPVESVPPEFQSPSRSGKLPIDLSRLRQTPPPEYRVDAGDVLGIYVEGILGTPDDVPPVTTPSNTEGRPALGYPILVQGDGQISLPELPELSVKGMTLREVRNRIRHAYTEENPLLKPGQDRILIDLHRQRSYRVLVIRQEDDGTTSGAGGPGQMDLTVVQRGTGQVVQLPAYENDVLHALTQTGGLPSSEAENAVYVIRRRPGLTLAHSPELPPYSVPVSQTAQPRPIQCSSHVSAPSSSAGYSQPRLNQNVPTQGTSPSPRASAPNDFNPYNSYRNRDGRGNDPVQPSAQAHNQWGYTIRGQSPSYVMPFPQGMPEETVMSLPGAAFWGDASLDNPEIIRIPLRISPGEQLPFSESDIILRDGDIVFVESRATEFFFTGGLLGGGQYRLPRDYDLDLLGAMSIVQSQVNTSFSSATRAVGGVSALNQDVTVGASKVIVLRKAPDGSEIRIKVDLYDAIRDPSQRVVIQPGDYLLLQYTRLEAVAAFFERHVLEGFVIGGASSLVFGNN